MLRVLIAIVVLCQLLCLAASQPSATSTSVSNLSGTQSSECVAFISSYPPTISMYASQICQVCQNLQLSPSIEPCCSNSNPTACFASSLYGTTVSDATRSAPITVSGASLGSVNCIAVVSIQESCQVATPSFNNLCFHDQQSCLCSTSGTWAPSYFDNYWSSCLAWASTAEPSSYSLLGPYTNGSVESRKCQSYAAFTATGGVPACLTSSSNALTTTSLASTGSAGLESSSSQGLALGARQPEGQVFAIVVIMQVITVYVVLA